MASLSRKHIFAVPGKKKRVFNGRTDTVLTPTTLKSSDI